MNWFLNNTHRKYMGLKELKDTYELVTYKGRYNEKFYLFFEQNKIKKVISYLKSDYMLSYREDDVDYVVTEDKKFVYSKKDPNKTKKLNITAINSFNGEGNYFYIYYYVQTNNGHAIIGNYTSQKTFYKDDDVKDITKIKDFQKWCDKYVNDSTDQDLEDVQNFAKEDRKHVKYKEGDYFRVKMGRNLYGYGRILMDVYKRRKHGFRYWDILMGRPLIIEMFHILTEDSNVSVEKLKKLKTFPSQHIFDNNFYYGDYEIIGNDKLPTIIKYPIMYGRSISALDPNKIMFQCGEIYREIEYKRDDYIVKEDFKNNGIGFYVNIKPKTIMKCIDQGSNNGYWEDYPYIANEDLRSPQNRNYLKKILQQFNLQYLFDIYNE